MNMRLIDKPSIILVDDHDIFRKGMVSLIRFEGLGTVVGEASDGMQFIDLLEVNKPDLVLLDINMPHLDGFEAAKMAIEKHPDLKIIAFTMFVNDEYCNKMMDIGVNGFVPKSSSLNDLIFAINEVLCGRAYYNNRS
jgi:DNA-binding NarL/FixJ family response regulator